MKNKTGIAIFDWLTDPGTSHFSISNNQPSIITRAMPLPSHIGKGNLQLVTLNSGMALAQSSYDFTPEAAGTLLPLAKVNAEGFEPFLAIHSIEHGRSIHRDLAQNGIFLPNQEISVSPGNDVVRFAKSYQATPVVDCSAPCRMNNLMIWQTMLELLIGKQETAQLLELLHLNIGHGLAVIKTPAHISSILHRAYSKPYVGLHQNLAIQSRLLDYLSSLIFHLENVAVENIETRNHVIAHEILGVIQRSTGHMPTLTDLAHSFNMSAKKLNEIFHNEFGKSIYVYLTEYRLNAAHDAISTTNIPLKQLAARTGYSHVNNFSIAFKNHFGYPPSSLRKT